MAFPVIGQMAPRQINANPWDTAFKNALANYQSTQSARFAPQRQQADIFAKEIGPLAALASNPNFTGFNPQIQKLIAERIGGYLGGQQDGQQPGMQETTPGYANDENIYQRLAKGAQTALSPGGQGNVAKSNIAGGLTRWIGDNPISKLLGGGQASEENAAFEQAKTEAFHRLKLKGYSDKDARDAVEQKPGESDQAYAARTKPLFLSQQSSAPIRNAQQKEERDNVERPNVKTVTITDPDGQKWTVTPGEVETYKKWWAQESQKHNKARG